MRKVILFNMVTLDGYFEGPNQELDWHNVDQEFDYFAIEQLNSADGLIFGRLTYQMMASFWPSEHAVTTDPIVAGKMNALPKIVFSRTLECAEWNNTRLVKGEANMEVRKLKSEPGNDLFIFGSANLASSLTKQGLIDEYRLMVNPVILGRGVPLFQGLDDKLKLKLSKNRSFRNGNVLLYYQPER